MSIKKWCTCEDLTNNDFRELCDLYSAQFIPTGWELEYNSINESESGRTLYIVGKCSVCKGKMKSGKVLPYSSIGIRLIEYIWEDYISYRPYNCKVFPKQNICLQKRFTWYEKQEQQNLHCKVDTFCKLFKKEDKSMVHRWIITKFPPAIFIKGIAYQYGVKAFHSGMHCVPAMDTAFLEDIISRCKQPGESIPWLTDWISGWTNANLKGVRPYKCKQQ